MKLFKSVALPCLIFTLAIFPSDGRRKGLVINKASRGFKDKIEKQKELVVAKAPPGLVDNVRKRNGNRNNPNRQPSAPTTEPTKGPTSEPTQTTQAPTPGPSRDTTSEPTTAPTLENSEEPTSEPTQGPTAEHSGEPTSEPTKVPTSHPSQDPSMEPTKVPTSQPSLDPSTEPTQGPTAEHSGEPTSEPTKGPTSHPSQDPSMEPTKVPTSQPSLDPSIEPTQGPTAEHSGEPTSEPTKGPTSHPSQDPSMEPTKVPTSQPSLNPSIEPTQGPTAEHSGEPTSGPTKLPTSHPSQDPSMEPTQAPSSGPTQSQTSEPRNLSPIAPDKDVVYGSLLHGAFNGARHRWAWPNVDLDGCTYPNNDNFIPCAVSDESLDRTLAFFSSYLDFKFEFDNNMMGKVTLGTEAAAGSGTQQVTFYPSAINSDNGAACSPPLDSTSHSPAGGYEIRLVRSGRYLHHWYVQNVVCGEETRMEIKVTPDCIELHLVSETDGSAPLNWIVDGQPVLTQNGYAPISFCIVCEEREEWSEALSSCEVVQVEIPTDCCPLAAENGLCGPGGPSTLCNEPLKAPLSSSIELVIESSVQWIEAGMTNLEIDGIFHPALDGRNFFFCGQQTTFDPLVSQAWPPRGTQVRTSCFDNLPNLNYVEAATSLVRQPTDDLYCDNVNGVVMYRLDLEQTEVVPDPKNSETNCLLNLNYPSRGDATADVWTVSSYLQQTTEPGSLEVENMLHPALTGTETYFCGDETIFSPLQNSNWPPAGTRMTTSCFDNFPDLNEVVATGTIVHHPADSRCNGQGMYHIPIEPTSDVEFPRDANENCILNFEYPFEVENLHHPAWAGKNTYFCGDRAVFGPLKDVNWPPVGTRFTTSCFDDFVGLNEIVAKGPLIYHPTRTDCGTYGFYQLPIEQTVEVRFPRSWTENCVMHATYPDPQPLPARGDGHSIFVDVPKTTGDILQNDSFIVSAKNTAVSRVVDPGLRKVKINFHINGPRGVTGIGAFLRDRTTKMPLGVHVQLSKNWHIKTTDRALYDSTWFTGIAHLRLPPGLTEFELVLVYQYFGALHGVSHSQLSLVGWGTNLLWEEVGLGSSGEAITYEPDPHHRRQTVLDTRPFLTCRDESGPCPGSPDTTGWTDNHGGSDFLAAVSHDGYYQYLVNNTAVHHMNGPRLTNATYHANTVDGNIEVTRTVSTWSVDDMARHLHSFRYEIIRDIPGNEYKRFAMYVFGGDNYNYIETPHFAHGMGENGIIDNDDFATITANGTLSAGHYAGAFYRTPAPAGCGQPSSGAGSTSCWFAMLTPTGQQPNHEAHRGIIVRNFQARLGGQDWPPTGSAVSESPFTFEILTPHSSLGAKLTLEIGLPAYFLDGLEAGTHSLQAGDFISGDIEQILPPRTSDEYFGNSERLRNWYTAAGVTNDYTNAWKIVALEAQRGDDMTVAVIEGALERKYLPRVRVDGTTGSAKFNLLTSSDWPGVMPITVSGVADVSSGKLWRWIGGEFVEFAPNGDYQVDRDVTDRTYSFTFSLRLEFDQVQACEQFYFGEVAPVIENECPIII